MAEWRKGRVWTPAKLNAVDHGQRLQRPLIPLVLQGELGRADGEGAFLRVRGDAESVKRLRKQFGRMKAR